MNRHLTPRTLGRASRDLGCTRLVLLLAFLTALLFLFTTKLVVLSAGLARVKRYVVDRASKMVAGVAAEDMSICPSIVDLAGFASCGEAVAEVGVGAEEGAG